ncbi:MAG: hypothetical protein R3Y07_01455 [Eubacteriales bacterium]
MNLYRKSISLCLSASMLLVVATGCSSIATEETTPPTTTGGDNATDSSIERMEITYWDAFTDKMEPGSYAESLIEAKLPVDIVVNRTNYEHIANVNSLLTEEKMPDVIWYSGGSEFMDSTGLTRTIPREMVEEYAPSFLELYDTYPTIYTSIVDADAPEEFFALNGATDQSAAIAGSLYADYYRYDWIQALDIDLGVNITQISDNFYVADTGLTLEKFEEVMEGFTYGDPDQNGKDDTYGASFESMSRFELLYSGFGMVNGVNEFNGEAERYYVTDAYKDFAVWFSDLYSKGYFDPEFYEQDRTERWEKVNNEEVGYFLESSIAINSWASDRPPLSLLQANPDATFLITPGLSDENGQGTMLKNAMPTFGRLCYINKDVDDEKLAMILQILEYTHFSLDTIPLWFGEEGIDWRYDENAHVEVINPLEIAEKGSRIFVQNVQVDDLFLAVSVEDVFEAGADFWLYDCIWRENDREQYEYKVDLLNETDYAALQIRYNSGCDTIHHKYFQDWVFHGLDVESSWSNYLEELDQAGYNIMMEELDKVVPLEEMLLEFTT